ncbi:MAG: AI-2E family transporter [Chloroflexota bacterium]
MSESNLEPGVQISPPWGRNTKTVVVVIILVLFALITYRFQSLIAQLTIAAILAYLLNPIIVFVNKRVPIRRSFLIALIYLILAVTSIWAIIALSVAAIQQVINLLNQLPAIIEQASTMLTNLMERTEPITIGPFPIYTTSLPWDQLTNQFLGLVEPAVSSGTQIVRQAATTTVITILNVIFIFFLSLYIAMEIPKIGEHVAKAAQQPGYRYDAERLMREFGRIWSSYLRGQVTVVFLIAFLVWLALTVMGVQNALALALLSGLLEFIPYLGPVIGGAVAVGVAFLQPSNQFGLEAWQFALLVLAVMTIIQQLEGNILVPRIMGEALDVHPILVMVAVFIGASLAGILGAILASPLLATIKLVGLYAWRKLFDLPPFPKPEPEPPPKPPLRERLLTYTQLAYTHLQHLRQQQTKQDKSVDVHE